MANDNDTPNAGGRAPKISMTAEELQNIIQTSVSAAVETALSKNQQGFEAIAEALLESRKPYKDPKQEANEEAFRKSTRELQERLRRNLKADQATCQHLQGSNSLSDFPSPHGLTCIVHHYLDTGELIGLCANCNHLFRNTQGKDPEADQEYKIWMTKKSGCRPSASGRRFFANPLEAIISGQS